MIEDVIPGSAWTWLEMVTEERPVRLYYFNSLDMEFGPTFIMGCTCFCFPTSLWRNGHGWADRQSLRRGISCGERASGIAFRQDPGALHSICDVGLGDARGSFDRRSRAVFTPFTDDD
jgi:hypothetical protein